MYTEQDALGARTISLSQACAVQRSASGLHGTLAVSQTDESAERSNLLNKNPT